MTWEQAKAMLEAQGITPTERHKELTEMGYTYHVLFPKELQDND